MKRLMTIFDTAPLITCCKFEVDGQPIVDHILPHCHIIIPSAVRQELVAEQADTRMQSLQQTESQEGLLRSEKYACPMKMCWITMGLVRESRKPLLWVWNLTKRLMPW
jgi:rRNA-processing protein FCF1